LPLVLSDDSCNTDSEAIAVLVGDCEVSLGNCSDRSSSAVKSPPLSVVTWLSVSESESVLVTTNVLMPEEDPVTRES